MSGTMPNFHGVYGLVGRADADHISTQTSDGEGQSSQEILDVGFEMSMSQQ